MTNEKISQMKKLINNSLIFILIVGGGILFFYQKNETANKRLSEHCIYSNLLHKSTYSKILSLDHLRTRYEREIRAYYGKSAPHDFYNRRNASATLRDSFFDKYISKADSSETEYRQLFSYKLELSNLYFSLDTFFISDLGSLKNKISGNIDLEQFIKKKLIEYDKINEKIRSLLMKVIVTIEANYNKCDSTFMSKFKLKRI